MRNILNLILVLVFAHGSVAGQTESQGALMNIGDTLMVSVDRLPVNKKIAEPNSSGYWNFRNLQGPFTRNIVIRPNNDASIQGDLVYSGVGGTDYFLIEDRGNLLITAFRLVVDGQAIIGRCDPYMPARLEDLAQDETRTLGGVVRFDLPLEIVAAFEEENLKFADSISVVYSWNYSISNDMSGQIDLESGLFEVDRQVMRKTMAVINKTKKNGTWSNVDLDFSLPVPEELMDGITYSFFDKAMAAPAAVVYADNRGSARSVVFKASQFSGRQVVDKLPSGPDIIVHPNPTFGFVRFDLLNLVQGMYTLEIYNIIGVKLKTLDVDVDGRLTIPFDLSDLRRGTYIYRLSSESGKTIRSKRLVIIQP